MTPDTFQRWSIKITKNKYGWQSSIARLLDVNRRTVVGWLQDGEVPDWVETKMESIWVGEITPAALEAGEKTFLDPASIDTHRVSQIYVAMRMALLNSD